MSDKARPQALRRDFLVGSAAGFAATRLTTLLANGRPYQPRGLSTSYARFGEDVTVAWILDQLHLRKTTYLDIGAYFYIYTNNTYILYEKGGRGVLVEPNIDLVPELRASRPGDIVLNAGVGLTEQAAAD